MMFFQILLLLGYTYAHVTARWLGPKKQFWVHMALLAISLEWLPIAAKTDLGFLSVEHPVTWVLVSLFLSVGFPFFVLAANAPLLQYWLSRTNHKDAANPYFLYSASNIGSLLALLGYPFLIEPMLTLHKQTLDWSLLFGAFVLLLAVCGYFMHKNIIPEQAIEQVSSDAPPPSWKNRLYWIALAFCPSSLMLGVTTYITTDVASVPLFWIIPLSLYLLTFIMAFAKKPMLVDKSIMAQAVLVPFVVMALAFDVNFISQMMILHLFAFFYIALGCHGLLSRNKPDARYLTEFFLWVSFGGMLGGVFNSLIAPVIFTTPIEYPLVLILSMFLRPPEGTFSKARRERYLDFMIPLDFALFLWVIFYSFQYVSNHHPETIGAINAWLGLLLGDPNNQAGLSLMAFSAVIIFLIFYTVAVMSSKRPVRYGLVLAAMLLVVPLTGSSPNSRLMHNVIYAERNFFGVNRVLHGHDSNAMMIMHGTTLHGLQSLDKDLRLAPVSYYGALGEVFDHVNSSIKTAPIAVLGLGAGSLACFGHKDQTVDFYEIDPAVAAIARNKDYFTYLKDCPPNSNIIMGDGRLSLAKAAPHSYGVVVVDVFSSDAIPIHLLTREALSMYKDRLMNHGFLLFNISNRHLNLAPVMATLAKDLNLKAYIKVELIPKGKLQKPSIWVLMTQDEKDISALTKENPNWKTLDPKEAFGIWTDDYSNIIQTLIF